MNAPTISHQRIVRYPRRTTELQPCPFCGSTAKWFAAWCYTKSGKSVITALDGGEIHGRVKCEGCGASTATLTKQPALAAWNRRLPNDQVELPAPDQKS